MIGTRSVILDQIIDDIARLIDDGVDADTAVDNILVDYQDIDKADVLEYFEEIYLCTPEQYERKQGLDIDPEFFEEDNISLEDLKDEGFNIDDDILGEM